MTIALLTHQQFVEEAAITWQLAKKENDFPEDSGEIKKLMSEAETRKIEWTWIVAYNYYCNTHCIDKFPALVRANVKLMVDDELKNLEKLGVTPNLFKHFQMVWKERGYLSFTSCIKSQ